MNNYRQTEAEVNARMVEAAYNRVIAKPRDVLERDQAALGRLRDAARRWAAVRNNARATRLDLQDAERALMAALGLGA